jgi:hypothetical protein
MTSLQLLTTVGGASSSGNTTGTGSTSASGNSTRTQTGTTTLANVTSAVNTGGINPSTAIPSEFPSGGGFLNGPPTQSHLILAAGIAGLATLCL